MLPIGWLLKCRSCGWLPCLLLYVLPRGWLLVYLAAAWLVAGEIAAYRMASELHLL